MTVARLEPKNRVYRLATSVRGLRSGSQRGGMTFLEIEMKKADLLDAHLAPSSAALSARGDPNGSAGLLRVYVSDLAFSGLFGGFGDCASLDEVRPRVV
jgi:hypothetical protein